MTFVNPKAAPGQPKSFMLVFDADGGGGYTLKRASKKRFEDVAPLGDTRMMFREQDICLDPGPGDTSQDPCLKAWIEGAGERVLCVAPSP